MKERGLRTPLSHWAALTAAILLYLVLFFVYYPPLAGIDDEIGYVNQAVIWSKGTLTAEDSGIAGYSGVNGWYTTWRNPGHPLLITPLIVLFGLGSIFISGAAIHAVLTLVAALICDTLERSPLWALLVLWHPTLSVYSRTIMGDTAAGLFVLLAVLAVLRFRRGWMWASLFLGVATWMRWHSALVIPFFVFVLWRELAPSRRKEAIQCLLVAAALIAPLLAYNVLEHGRPGGQSLLGLGFFFPNLGFYAVSLLLIWPGMLLSLVYQSRLAAYTWAMCVPIVLFFCFYFFHDQGATFLQTEILGQRLLLCILPVWIVMYGLVLSEHWLPVFQARLGRPAIAAAMAGVAALLLLAQWYTFSRHQAQLLTLQGMRNEVARNVPPNSVILANAMVRKLFGIPDPALPRYQWLIYDLEHSATLPSTRWYLAFFPKRPGDEISDGVAEYATAHNLTRIPTSLPGLLLFETPPTLYDKR